MLRPMFRVVLIAAVCWLAQSNDSHAQVRTPSQIAASACFECYGNLAETFDSKRDCANEVAAKELLVCTMLCDAADNEDALEALKVQAQACIDLIKNRDRGGLYFGTAFMSEFGRTNR